jgi:putative addiction module component (TIGR02574 family)
MSPTVEQIIQAALALPIPERERVIDELVISCEPENGPPLDEAWMAEIQRRSAELDAGLVKPIPWEEVKARLTRKD